MHHVYSTTYPTRLVYFRFGHPIPGIPSPEEAHLPGVVCLLDLQVQASRTSNTHVLEIPRYFCSPRGRGTAIKKTAGGRFSQRLC